MLADADDEDVDPDVMAEQIRQRFSRPVTLWRGVRQMGNSPVVALVCRAIAAAGRAAMGADAVRAVGPVCAGAAAGAR